MLTEPIPSLVAFKGFSPKADVQDCWCVVAAITSFGTLLPIEFQGIVRPPMGQEPTFMYKTGKVSAWVFEVGER